MMSGISPELHPAALVEEKRCEALNSDGVAWSSLALVAQSPATSELPGRLIVIDYSQPGSDGLLEAYARRRPDCAMLLIGRDLPTSAVRSLFRFATSDVLDADATVPDILAAAGRLAGQLQSGVGGSADAQGATCWALRGAVGGAGVTTLAIEMAFAALRQRPSWRVCLIDLNLCDGMSASFLDAERKLDVSALSGSPERIDASLLSAYAYEHPRGIFLMAAARNPQAEETAQKACVLQLLDVACSMFDQVIVDVPRHRTPWTDTVLGAVDEVFVVSELTVPSLHAAGDLCREIDLLRTGHPTRLLLNRMFAKRSHRHSFPVEKAERAIHRQIDHSIRSDWEHARMAVNLGMPVAQAKPKSPLVKDVNEVTRAVLASRDEPMVQAAA